MIPNISYHSNSSHVQNVIDSEVDASGLGYPVRMRAEEYVMHRGSPSTKKNFEQEQILMSQGLRADQH